MLLLKAEVGKLDVGIKNRGGIIPGSLLQYSIPVIVELGFTKLNTALEVLGVLVIASSLIKSIVNALS